MLFTPRQKYRLLNWQRYERYARALGPVLWHPCRRTTGSISTNAAYGGGVGLELLTNGDFSAWAAGNPTGWTVDETPPNSEISENPAGQCQIVSDGTLAQVRQAVLTAGDTYRSTIDISAITGGVAHGTSSSVTQVVSTTGIKAFDFIADAVNYSNRRSGTCSASINRASCRKIGQLDGLIAGTTALGQAGLLGVNEAFLFDGATSLITITNRASIQGLTAFTLWALFKPSIAGEGDAGTLFSKSGEFEVRFNSASRDLIATVNYSSTNAQRVTSTTLSADEWHTVGMRIDNSGKLPEIFVDGVQASYASSTSGVGTRASTTNHLIVGNNATVSQTLAGLLDEFLLVNRPLTASELRLLHLLSGLD